MESVLIEPINIFDNENTTENKELCSICLDEINEENVDSIYTLNTCNHKFHCKCIVEMFISGYNDTCPLCRTIIQNNNNICKDYDKFKLNLLLKYSKKPNANKLVVKLVEKYKISNKKLNTDRKNLSTLLRKKKSMVCFKDINKFKYQIRNLKKSKSSVRFKAIKKSTTRFSWFNSVRYIKKYDFIKNSIKKCNTEIKNYINETIFELENKVKNIENLNNGDMKNLREEIKRAEAKYRRSNKSFIKLKNTLLNVPLNPMRV